MKRVAILISGGGSNMARLIEAMRGDFPARPVLIGSNNPQAGGLVRAREMAVDIFAVDHRDFKGDRQGFEAELLGHLRAARPDIVCLAGFMRILTPQFVDRFSGRILNIHPSLLPKYPGLHTHRLAIEAGDDEAGASVHLVTPDLDAGTVLGQVRVSIRAGDTAQLLAARVLEQEHRLYAAVLRRFAQGDHTPLHLDARD